MNNENTQFGLDQNGLPNPDDPVQAALNRSELGADRDRIRRLRDPNVNVLNVALATQVGRDLDARR